MILEHATIPGGFVRLLRPSRELRRAAAAVSKRAESLEETIDGIGRSMGIPLKALEEARKKVRTKRDPFRTGQEKGRAARAKDPFRVTPRRRIASE